MGRLEMCEKVYGFLFSELELNLLLSVGSLNGLLELWISKGSISPSVGSAFYIFIL
jgi:hypothetical protein